MNEAIVTKGLTKYYGKARGIIDVDLAVSRGEVFGFLGPNGAGKTTTIRLLMDLIRPTSGSAQVLGIDPQKDGARVRRSIGYLPSDFGTYSSMTARKYLHTLLDMMGHQGDNRIEEVAKRIQLDLDRRIKDFSRGNRQKVGIVSCFMHTPPLIIMDEPTSGLDPLMQQEFYRMVLEERRAGRTVFLSSHILAEVEAICDRVAIIKDGRILVTEKISAFKKKTGKVMTVTFAERVDLSRFSSIPGVSHVEEDGDHTLKMTVSSNINALIKEIARYDIEDLDYEELSLERMFLRYYEGDGGDER